MQSAAVDAEEFEVRLSRVLAALDESVTLLERYDAEHWAEWLRADMRRIASGDRGGLDHLLQAFGGMGSLNDLVLEPTNGAMSDSDDRLDVLRNTMFIDAVMLRRALGGHHPAD